MEKMGPSQLFSSFQWEKIGAARDEGTAGNCEIEKKGCETFFFFFFIEKEINWKFDTEEECNERALHAFFHFERSIQSNQGQHDKLPNLVEQFHTASKDSNIGRAETCFLTSIVSQAAQAPQHNTDPSATGSVQCSSDKSTVATRRQFLITDFYFFFFLFSIAMARKIYAPIGADICQRSQNWTASERKTTYKLPLIIPKEGVSDVLCIVLRPLLITTYFFSSLFEFGFAHNIFPSLRENPYCRRDNKKKPHIN